MENLYIKEKRLQSVLDKLKNLGNLPNANTQEIDRILVEKNQLQSEKIEIEKKYNDLLLKYADLKSHLKKIEDDKKKNKKLQEQFNQDIDELGEETNSLVEEIEKWQI